MNQQPDSTTTNKPGTKAAHLELAKKGLVDPRDARFLEEPDLSPQPRPQVV
ncbi:hypothetical protein IQ250_30030, partial [Pseudanabaenaceae cyanobacterium LEGE 13415]|nr:hypothetical protein [Pseudanabaenaceae cyanobacterium LEGE 13415]